MDDISVVDRKTLKALGIRYSTTHLTRKEKAGTFPHSFKLGDDRNSPVVWWRRDIVEWLKFRASKATAP
jgi:predicted DNA-binding transcriptional regulator AlpA